MTVEERRRVHRAGQLKRLKNYGDFFTYEARQRGGRVAAHQKFHQERFSEHCLICLEELRDQQIKLFSQYA